MIFSKEALRAVEWLKNHQGPQDVLIAQRQSAYEAKKAQLDEGCSVHNYFGTFPALKATIGRELWTTKRDILIAALNDCRQLRGEDAGYYHALPALTEQNKDSILFYLLPYLISQQRGSRGPRISIREKQESFFIHAQTASDIVLSLNRQR